MSRSTLWPFRAVKSDSSILNLTDLKDFNLSQNVQKSEHAPSGSLDVLCTYLASAGPVGTYTTHDLLTFFTECDPALVLPITNAVATAIGRDTGEDNGFLTTGTIYQAPKATIVPLSLNASQSDTDGAALQFAVVYLYDGINRIINKLAGTVGTAVSPPACLSKYFMGPSKIGTDQIPNIESTTIEFGINYSAKGFNGSPYPTEGAIISRRPSFVFKTTDLGIAPLQNMLLRPVDDPLTVYFQRAVTGDDRAAATDPVHLAFSCQSGAICEDDLTLTGNEDGTVNLKVTPHGPVTVNVATAIT